MAFLQEALDDPTAAPCGRCDVCAGPWYSTDVPQAAAEAAACGALPVSADHSGAREVSRLLAPALPAAARPLLSFPIDEGAVEAIADRLNRWLALDLATREETRQALTARVRELWSWESVASGVLAASAGRLDELPVVS